MLDYVYGADFDSRLRQERLYVSRRCRWYVEKAMGHAKPMHFIQIDTADTNTMAYGCKRTRHNGDGGRGLDNLIQWAGSEQAHTHTPPAHTRTH